MEFNILYEDENVLVIDKPAGVNADDFPKRVHRLDKDTSGVLIVAKNDKTLEFLQKQFKERRVEKKYIALIVGHLKTKQGIIETLIGRSPKDRRKQKVFLAGEPDSQGKREAVTKYKVLKRLKNFDLVEITPKTGRKHQIRCHFAYLGHPIVGDKMYGFKNQILPKGLKRHFLHASYLKIKLPDGKEKEFQSDLSEDLKSALEKLNEEKEE
jgi:23S rRNA pseudouridine1911/1915/1917 synthase